MRQTGATSSAGTTDATEAGRCVERGPSTATGEGDGEDGVLVKPEDASREKLVFDISSLIKELNAAKLDLRARSKKARRTSSLSVASTAA